MGDVGSGDFANYVDIIGLYFAVFVGLYLPYKALRSQQKLARDPKIVTRTQLILSTFVLQFVLAFAAWVVTRSDCIDVWPKHAPKLLGVAAGVVLLVVCVVTLPLRIQFVRQAKTPLLRPTSARELPLWIVLSFVAGIGEEFVYRGVLTEVLRRQTGDVTLAIALSALAFGAAHIVQGWKLALFVVFVALGLQYVVVAAGSLYVAMAVHVLYDVCAGVYYSRKL